jgi:hypothetical protein
MPVWTPRTTGLDGWIVRTYWSALLTLAFAGGSNADGTETIATSADLLTWATHGAPIGEAGGDAYIAGSPNGFVDCPGLSKVVAVGGAYVGSSDGIATTPDGAAWTPHGNPFDSGSGGFGIAVDWSESQGRAVAVGRDNALGGVIVSSPDLSAWTPHSNHLNNRALGVGYSPDLDIWAACGVAFGFDCTAYSADGLTWSDGDSSAVGWSGFGSTNPTSVRWFPSLSAFLGFGGGNPIGISTDGMTWTPWANDPRLVPSIPPIVDGFFTQEIFEAGANLAALGYGFDDDSGYFALIYSTDLGSTWQTADGADDIFAGGLHAAGSYSPDLDLVFLGGASG